MATVVNIDFSGLGRSLDELKGVLGKGEWTRALAVEIAGIMHYRIHEKGLDSQDRPIGSYSSSYLNHRKNNKLGADPKIILVQTRKTANSWTAVPLPNGWGVGFSDDGATEGVTAMQKIRFIEQRIGRAILNLSPSENQYITDRVPDLLNELFK